MVETPVAVFRHTLYKPSERFIPDQASHLGRPVIMIARDPIIGLVEGLHAESLSARDGFSRFRYTVLRDDRVLRALLLEQGVGVVHAHFGVEGMYAQRATQHLGLPQATTLHGYDVTVSDHALISSRSPAWIHYGLGRRRFLDRSPLLICVSEYIRERAIALGARPESTVVVGTGIDTVAISPSRVPEAPIVLHVGRLVEKKGTRYLLEAFARVLEIEESARLRIVGDGPLRGALEALASALGISGAVEFLGAQGQDRVIAEMRDARVLALPSVTAATGDAEGLGQVVLEAAAVGRPVVVTANGGMRDAAIDDVTGLVVSERDAGGLAEALLALLSDAGLAAKLGAAGRTFVEQRFDLKSQAAKVRQLYEEIG
ncbi:glycosyltransferase [Cellulomonas sp. ICMP 17802]|uniref:glycosyltransferase n=1 Tax=Cellulomonas sp. ICMP 17802 TaxID=3239199 RepID=UPI00351B6D2E